MCLGIPGQIQSIRVDPDTHLPFGTVAFGPIQQDICLALVDASVNDYIIAHAGFAIALVDETNALRTIALFKQMELEP